MAWPWAPKWDPATPIFSRATLNTNFSINTKAPNLTITVATLMTVSTPLPPPDRNSIAINHMSRITCQFLRLRRLCSEDSEFSLKSEEVREFFDKRGYPAYVVEAGHHRAQQIDRQSALQTSQKENNIRIPFTLTFHPHNHAVKSIIPKNFKLLQNDLAESFRNRH